MNSSSPGTARNARPSAEEALALLERAGAGKELLAHCRAVRDVALSVCGTLPFPLDRQLVETGALLHDLGRTRTNGILHVIEGVRIAEELGLCEDLRRIIERHVGAGLTASEARQAGLPHKEYLPQTPEEKIVAYADNLVYGNQGISFEKSLERFSRQLGRESPVVQRMIALHHEIQGWARGEPGGRRNTAPQEFDSAG